MTDDSSSKMSRKKKINYEIITGLGCYNCGADQLTEYYEVKIGNHSPIMCKKCKPVMGKLKKAKIINRIRIRPK